MPKWGGPKGHFTWPLHPPTRKIIESPQKHKTNKEGLVALRATSPGPQKKQKQKAQNQKKQEKPTNTKNELCNYRSKFLCLFCLPIKPLFNNLAPKARTPKTLKNRGFRRSISENQLTVTKRPFLDPKQIPFIIYVCPFFALNNKTQKTLNSTIFIVFLESKEMGFFNPWNKKQGTRKTTNFAHNLWKKTQVLETCLVTGPQKTLCKKLPETTT